MKSPGNGRSPSRPYRARRRRPAGAAARAPGSGDERRAARRHITVASLSARQRPQPTLRGVRRPSVKAVREGEPRHHVKAEEYHWTGPTSRRARRRHPARRVHVPVHRLQGLLAARPARRHRRTRQRAAVRRQVQRERPRRRPRTRRQDLRHPVRAVRDGAVLQPRRCSRRPVSTRTSRRPRGTRSRPTPRPSPRSYRASPATCR